MKILKSFESVQNWSQTSEAGRICHLEMVCDRPIQQFDAMNHESAKTAAYWTVHAASWTLRNHVRTIASAGSGVCFVIGCLVLSGS